MFLIKMINKIYIVTIKIQIENNMDIDLDSSDKVFTKVF